MEYDSLWERWHKDNLLRIQSSRMGIGKDEKGNLKVVEPSVLISIVKGKDISAFKLSLDEVTLLIRILSRWVDMEIGKYRLAYEKVKESYKKKKEEKGIGLGEGYYI